MSSRGPLRVVVVGVLVSLSPLILLAAVEEAQLRSEYQGKVLTLRHPVAGDRLRFDAAGHATEAGMPGVWTVEGEIHVEGISLSNGILHLRGRRAFLFYDPDSKQMRDLATVPKGEYKGILRKNVGDWAIHNGKVEVELNCPSVSTMSEVEKCVQGVFLGPDESLGGVAPRFWKRWLGADKDADPRVENSSKKDDSEAENKAYKVSGGISPPHVISAPDPDYSSAAKAAHYQATSVLWLVVNPSGFPEHIRIQKPAGLGLDEQAVAAVLTWKFKPALKGDQPVPVQINVEVNFKLY